MHLLMLCNSARLLTSMRNSNSSALCTQWFLHIIPRRPQSHLYHVARSRCTFNSWWIQEVFACLKQVMVMPHTSINKHPCPPFHRQIKLKHNTVKLGQAQAT